MTKAKPKCPYCKKTMRRDTSLVCAPREPFSTYPVPNWRYTGNLQVVKRHNIDCYLGEAVLQADPVTGYPDGLAPRTVEQRLSAVSVWDGESYVRPTFGYFCSKVCAARFGQEMYKRGGRLS